MKWPNHACYCFNSIFKLISSLFKIETFSWASNGKMWQFWSSCPTFILFDLIVWFFTWSFNSFILLWGLSFACHLFWNLSEEIIDLQWSSFHHQLLASSKFLLGNGKWFIFITNRFIWIKNQIAFSIKVTFNQSWVIWITHQAYGLLIAELPQEAIEYVKFLHRLQPDIWNLFIKWA